MTRSTIPTWVSVLVAVGAIGTLILMRKWLLRKAYERRRNTWFAPDDLAQKAIDKYEKENKQ